jgi:hypothetical protein
LRAISCQAEKQLERKDAHRKPLLPDLRVAEVRCWPSFPPLVYISNIEYFVTLKSCLRILFLSQGTNAVWGFNFLRVGGLKLFKLLKCILAGGRKGKLFCNFWIVRGFARIANVLAFVRWLGRHYATFVLSNLNVCATLVIVWANVLFVLEYILSNIGYVLVLLAHILSDYGLVCYGLLYGLF